MLKGSHSFYHFKDSISAYLKADSIHRVVMEAESSYNFNPIPSNIEDLARAYYSFRMV